MKAALLLLLRPFLMMVGKKLEDVAQRLCTQCEKPLPADLPEWRTICDECRNVIFLKGATK